MKPLALTALLACLLIPSCGKKTTPQTSSASEGTGVLTTFYPTTYFAERISGGLVPVVCPLPSDADPIYWQPTREALAAYQDATLILLNGADFEKWVSTASLPESRVFECYPAPPEQLIRYENATVHRHGPEGEHAHEGIDGHTWLAPQIAISKARLIENLLSERWPDHASQFQANHDALVADLNKLHERFQTVSLPAALASHPAYNYLAKAYGWGIDNLDLDPEAMPSDAQLADIASRLEKRPTKILLWESEPLPEIAETLNSRFGLKSIVFSPCETPSDAGDYLAVMNANIDRLENAGNP